MSLQDFSPTGEAAAEEVPQINSNPDGSQFLQLGGMALDLPVESTWRLELNAGEYYVVADGRTPKSVKGLMKLKRVKTLLGLSFM